MIRACFVLAMLVSLSSISCRVAAKKTVDDSNIASASESDVNAKALAVAKSVMAKRASKDAVAAVILSFNTEDRHIELRKELKFDFYGIREFPGYWGDVIQSFRSETEAMNKWLNGDVDCDDCYFRGKDICYTNWTIDLNHNWILDIKKNRIPVIDLDGTTPLKRSQLLVRKHAGLPKEIAELPSVYITEQMWLGQRDRESRIVYKEIFLNDSTGKRWRWLMPER